MKETCKTYASSLKILTTQIQLYLLARMEVLGPYWDQYFLAQVPKVYSLNLYLGTKRLDCCLPSGSCTKEFRSARLPGLLH